MGLRLPVGQDARSPRRRTVDALLGVAYLRRRSQEERTILVLLVILAGLVMLFWIQWVYFMTVDTSLHIGRRGAGEGLVVVGLSILMISGGVDTSGVIRRRELRLTKLLTILLIVSLVESRIRIMMLATVMISIALINAGVAATAALLVSLACAMGMGGVTAFCKRRLHKLRVSGGWPAVGSLLLLLGGGAITFATADPVEVESPTWWTYWLPGDVPLHWSASPVSL